MLSSTGSAKRRYNSRMQTLLISLLILLPALAWGQASSSFPAPKDVAAPPADASKQPDGLATKVIKSGTGTVHPAKDDLVVVHYNGWTTDGKMFDSSVVRGQPATFAVNRVIPGFSEGLQLMVKGEERRLWIPEALAYKGRPGAPKGMLVFDVTLIDLPTHAPDDVKEPPPDAIHTPSGLAYKVLKQGTGTQHPKRTDEVTVNYTGWSTNGKMFDSSLTRGQPATFPLNGVIAGWTEGVQLMVEGEKVRFWIPERLAYQGRQEPYGNLTFDVELLKIK